MTDGRHRLALLGEGSNERDCGFVRTQVIRIAHTARKDERIEVLGADLIESDVRTDRLSRVVVHRGLNRLCVRRGENDLGSAAEKDFARTEKLRFFEAISGDNQYFCVCNIRHRESYLHNQEPARSTVRLVLPMSEEKQNGGRLRHSSDGEPGYTRRKKGRYWQYFDEDGERVTDREIIDRLNGLALPPAYTDAWFCKDANGHLQATGVDARGRKQYRYHPDYRARRDKKKYTGTLEFGAALPKLRRKVAADLKKSAHSREAVLAAVVRLLDVGYLRVGNEEYARDNKSFGATTLRSRHLQRRGNRLMMRFKGKHGIIHEVPITDSKLKRVVTKCDDLPGQHLFQYLNGDGEPCAVTSSDVNDYIREATGGDFTAKNFRTWGASVIAFDQMLTASEHEKARISLKTVLEPVAEALGNTPAISRKSYVHPKLIEAARDRPRNPLNGLERPRDRKWLSAQEVGLLKFLAGRKRSARDATA